MEPLILQTGAGETEMTVVGSRVDLPNSFSVVVLYRNTRDEPLKGLSLRLPVPDDAQIIAAARGEKLPVPAGKREWQLPDLSPGALQRFEFTVQLLAAGNPTIELSVEIQGQGFQQPVKSDPVIIKVRQ